MSGEKFIPGANGEAVRDFRHDASGVSVHFDEDLAMFVLRGDARVLFNQSIDNFTRIGGDRFVSFSVPMAALREMFAGGLTTGDGPRDMEE